MTFINMDKTKLLAILESNLKWLVLGSLISADSNLDNKSRSENIDRLKNLRDVMASYKGDDKAKILGYIEDGIKILTQEINGVEGTGDNQGI